MAEHTQNLTRPQERAILALLCERDVPGAAKAANVGERTLYRWLAEDEIFKAAYIAARRSAVQQGISRLQQSMTTAVDTLEEVAKDTTAPASARVRAARSIADLALKAVEIEDILMRIAALEQRAT